VRLNFKEVLRRPVELASINGHKVIEHGGAWQAFTCDISRYVDDGITVVVLTNLDSAQPEQFAHVISGFVNPALEPRKMIAIEDKHPELAGRLGALLDQIAAGKDVKDQLTPELAALLTPRAASWLVETVRLIWPSRSLSLSPHRNRRDHRIGLPHRQGNETRIVTFGLSHDGKVATLKIQPDPDVR
jgi:hypothetical protein